VTDAVLAIAVLAVPLGSAALVALLPTPRAADRLNLATSGLTAALALALAVVALAAAPGEAARGSWYVLDAASGVFLALVAVIGFASAAVSPSYLRHAGRSWFSARRSHAWYYAAFNLFWAALLALPLADNLALAWLLIEATTAASALLVAFSGKRSALEAGWKYVVLTWWGWPARSAGRRCTTGCPTLTARRRRRSARCSPQRCSRPCC
jgi:hydrogenase-4 component F